MVAVPDRLEDRVREAQVEDLGQPELAEVVVDPVELALVEVLVHLGGERPRGLEVVAERLLDDDARVRGETGAGEPLDDRAEQERRDLEIEDRAPGVLEHAREALERRRVREVPGEVGEPGGEPLEDLGIERLAGGQDRLAGTLLEVVDRPVVDGDADDRARQEPALLEAVERVQRHHLGQVAGDAEHDEDVGGLLEGGVGCRGSRVRMGCGGHAPMASANRARRHRPEGVRTRTSGAATILR